MIAAMDVVGNPSSVHAEGRAARGIVETARGQVAEAFGCARDAIVFTASATEAAAMALQGQGLRCAAIEHDAVVAHADEGLAVSGDGLVEITDVAQSALQGANSETGVVQDIPAGLGLSDQVQAFGKLPIAFEWIKARTAILSAHKIGGPKGVGALVLGRGVDIAPLLRGGGQEMGRRSGTENVIGIAGFGAAAAAAKRDLEDGVWDRVKKLRMILENMLEEAAPGTILVGRDTPRLPNTSCFISPGWKGETQVMAMDLAGYAISSGSACSSGKVKTSRVLSAMGFDAVEASSAIRVSLGPTTSEEDVTGFARTWIESHKRWMARAA
jgi:cysteine desulfurase